MSPIETKDINCIITAHTYYAFKPGKEFRKFDQKTPAWTHPLWCAMTILSETTLDENLRRRGSQVLLYHDMDEDTKRPLPGWLTDDVRQDVYAMTYKGGFTQEVQEIWTKPIHIKLFKLYDKTHNLLDGSWMSPEKKSQYKEYTLKLANEVEQQYGNLNILQISRNLL